MLNIGRESARVWNLASFRVVRRERVHPYLLLPVYGVLHLAIFQDQSFGNVWNRTDGLDFSYPR